MSGSELQGNGRDEEYGLAVTVWCPYLFVRYLFYVMRLEETYSTLLFLFEFVFNTSLSNHIIN